MRFLVSTVALCLIGLASAQNIYDGCGVDKECLGYEPDNPAENACLEAQVCWSLVNKVRQKFLILGLCEFRTYSCALHRLEGAQLKVRGITETLETNFHDFMMYPIQLLCTVQIFMPLACG